MNDWGYSREVEKVKPPTNQPPLSLNDEPALLVTHDGDDDWSVWISLPDHDPVLDSYGFIIGSGETRQDALTDAVRSLEALVNRIQQSPAGWLRERAL